MEKHIDYPTIAPQVYKAMAGLEIYVRHSGLEPDLLELVKTRVSQINRCAFCLDMHTKEARTNGETELRLYALPAWRETPFYSVRERAALSWAEALTEIAAHSVPAGLQEEMLCVFSEKELIDLTLAIVAINGWNRLSIACHTPAGSYRPDGAQTK
ncbi:MAG: carboxymuconolactone decarboxylase family protein [Burkholderiales bacterium]